MVQQSVLNGCPAANQCFGFIKPKWGTRMTSCGGILLSIFYMSVFDAGIILQEIGFNDIGSQIIRHIYAALGVLMLAINIILLFSTFSYNEFYVLMWMWFTILFIIIDSQMVLAILICGLVEQKFLLAPLIFITDVLFWVFVYMTICPIVNGFRRSIHTVVIFLG